MGLREFFVVSLVACGCGAFQFVFQAGPLVPASKGEVWPKPQNEDKIDDKYFTVLPFFFSYQSIGNSCETLDKALERYKYITNYQNRYIKEIYYEPSMCYGYNDSNFLGYLFTLNVELTGPCNDTEYPTLDMKEEYILNVTEETQKLTSETLWGILRGLETFSQLIYMTDDFNCFRIETTNVHDYPRFSHRGLLLDTSRHYHSKDSILRLLDAMSYNKLNVFHWHITDDYSFPYVSTRFPEMSTLGAFHPTLMVYDQDFVREMQEYARERGIRVLAEFDTPGHTLSWGLGNPELLTKCVGIPDLEFGPIDPSKDSTFKFIYKFFDEIKSVFKDEYTHLGGDEVDFRCWASNPNISIFMNDMNMKNNYVELQDYYIQRVINYVSHLYLKSIVWEEVFTNGVYIPEETIVQIWKSDNPKQVLNKVTEAGHRAIISSHWYLDILATGGDWLKFFNADPLDFPGTEEQKKRVVGAETCMWSEVVNENNLESRVWPRASAAAERFWSAPVTPTTDIAKLFPVAQRLEEQTCRMRRRGIKAQPATGPSVCF